MATAKKAAKNVVKKMTPAVKKTAAAKKKTSRKPSKPSVIESLVGTVAKTAKKLIKASKRTLVEPHAGDKRYVRRDGEGKFKNEVDVGKSLSADKRTKAKNVVKPGQGDKGDLRR